MTYETAEKLKNAGYPQGYPIECPCGNCEGDLDGYCGHGKEDAVYYPSLSELIEMCGFIYTGMDSFKLELMPLGAGWRASANKAVCYTENDSIKTTDFHLTSEEAVANLWLKLNK